MAFDFDTVIGCALIFFLVALGAAALMAAIAALVNAIRGKRRAA